MASESPPSSPNKRKKAKVDPRELALKYKRLAEEYNKIKRENAILKRAVLQEQQTAKGLGESLKEKEMRVRVVEQENDQLTYHNDRLTKRVSFLQEANEKNENKSSGWFFGGSKDLPNASPQVQVLVEELERKNKENMQLHHQVQSIKQEQEQILDLLQKKMERVKADLRAKQEQSAAAEAAANKSVNEVTKERDEFFDKMKSFSDDLTIARRLLDERKREIIDLEVKHRIEIKKSKDLISRQITFDDTQNSRLNALNLPSFDKSLQTRLSDIMSAGMDLLSQLATSCYTESSNVADRIDLLKKSRDLDSQLTHIYEKMAEISDEFSQYLEPIRNDLEQIFACLRTFQTVPQEHKKRLVDNFNQFLMYHQKLLASRTLAYQEESKQRDCVKETQQQNSKLTSLTGEFQMGLEKIVVSLSLLCGADDEKISKKNFVVILKHIHEALVLLQNSKKEFSAVLAKKFAKEHEDAFILPKLKTVNEQYIQATQNSANLFEQIAKKLTEYIDALANPPSRPVRGATLPPNSGLFFLEDIHKRANANMAILNGIPDPVSVSYPDQLANVALIARLNQEYHMLEAKYNAMHEANDKLQLQELKSATELSVCKDAIAAKQSQLAKIMTELVDTRQKLESAIKLNQKLQAKQSTPEPSQSPASEVQKEEGTGIDPNTPTTTSTAPAVITQVEENDDFANGSNWTLTVVDENGNQSNTLGVTSEDREREQKLKDHYEQKCSQLEQQLRTADSKAVDLWERKEQLEKQLKQVREERDDTRNKLSQFHSQASQSRDDLESTKTSYREQLAVLSEHVIELNEKIASTTEELETIKKYKVRCGKCKNWNTLEWLMTEGKNGRYCSKGPHASSFNFA